MEGMIVCIDGIDSAGKATQAQLLKESLEAKGIKVSVHSYPDYSSTYGKIVNQHLHKEITLSVNELLLLFIADMAREAEAVRQELKRGDLVVMDRYFIDTVAYQTAGGLNYEGVKTIEKVIDLPKPSLVVYLDIPVAVSFERTMKDKGEGDRNEADKAYLEKVRDVFDMLYQEHYTGAQWVKVDGTMPIMEVRDKIMFAIADYRERILEKLNK